MRNKRVDVKCLKVVSSFRWRPKLDRISVLDVWKHAGINLPVLNRKPLPSKKSNHLEFWGWRAVEMPLIFSDPRKHCWYVFRKDSWKRCSVYESTPLSTFVTSTHNNTCSQSIGSQMNDRLNYFWIAKSEAQWRWQCIFSFPFLISHRLAATFLSISLTLPLLSGGKYQNVQSSGIATFDLVTLRCLDSMSQWTVNPELLCFKVPVNWDRK